MKVNVFTILGILFVLSGIEGIVESSKSLAYIPLGIILIIIGIVLFKKGLNYVAKPRLPKSIKQKKSLAKSNIDKTAQTLKSTDVKKTSEFESILNSMPCFPISTDGKKVEKKENFSDKVPHSKVTSMTDHDGSYVAIDIETTGLSMMCDIIEVAAVRFRGFKPVEKFSTLTKPPQKISKEIANLTGITNDMLVGSPHFYQILPSLQEFIGSDNIVGHNINFDVPRLIVHGLDLLNEKRKFYDTLDLAKKLHNGTSRRQDCRDGIGFDVLNFKLGTLLEHYHINVPSLHRALHDACATGILFKEMVSHDARVKADTVQSLHANLPIGKPISSGDFTDNEIKTFEIVKSIIEQSGRNVSSLRCFIDSKNIFCLSIFGDILKIKLRGRKTYVLFDKYLNADNYDFSNFTIEESPKSENSLFRIIVNVPHDLLMLKQMILDEYDEAISLNAENIETNPRVRASYEHFLKAGYC